MLAHVERTRPPPSNEPETPLVSRSGAVTHLARAFRQEDTSILSHWPHVVILYDYDLKMGDSGGVTIHYRK